MLKLRKYQRQGVRRIEEFGMRALLADEMGLGKTPQALEVARRNGLTRSTIIVCPATVKYHWQRLALQHCGVRAEILESRKPTRRGFLHQKTMLIINYDILKWWVPFLRRTKPKLIIIDESQYIKSRDSQRTKACRDLCDGIKYVLGLSGTPIENRPAEFFPILNILRPDLWPYWTPFADRYCGRKKNRFGQWEAKGATKIPELNRKLRKRVMIRRLKADVLPELPPNEIIVQTVPIKNPKEYAEAERDFAGWLKRTYIPKMQLRGKQYRKIKNLLRMERLVKFGFMRRLAAQLKRSVIEEWIDNFLEQQTGKLIVFGIHKTMVRGLHAKYKQISTRVDGSVTGRNRDNAVLEFREKKRCRILFGNSKAAGVGWDGTIATTTLVVEFPWTPGELTQAMARMHRFGQKRKTRTFLLVAHDTVEVRLCEMLEAKHGVIQGALDGSRRIGSLDIIDKLTKDLIRKAK